MSLLTTARDIVVNAGGDWDLIAIDFTDQLLAFSLGSSVSIFTDAIDPLKSLYSITSTEIDALNALTAPVIAPATLVLAKQDLFEYRDIWAEEGGAIASNTSEWSYGNGATGFMGLVVDEGWEVVSMYFQADTYAATATAQVDLMDYGNTPSNAAGNTIASISLNSSTDGGGATNNGYKIVSYANSIPVPVTGASTVIGFLTRIVTGTISDVRVGARLRRKVGEYVSDVTLA